MHAPRITPQGLVDPGGCPLPVDDRPTIPHGLGWRADRRPTPGRDRAARAPPFDGGERAVTYDGHVLELAERAAEAVRELNHRTRDFGAFSGPAELYRLVGELTVLAGGLPQLLSQLDRWLKTERDAGRLRADIGTGAGRIVVAAGADLADAGGAAHEMARALNAALAHLAHLGTTDPGHAVSGRG